MDDLISRQMAIDAIKYNQDVYSHNFHDDPIDKYTTAIIATDIDTLLNLPSAQPEQRWIPCSERLPENDDWEIVTVKDERGDSKFTYSYFGWYLDVAKCWIVEAEQRTDVIAWMPLPEPYDPLTGHMNPPEE